MSFTNEELDDWFKAFDADGSGKIEASELRELVKAFHEWQEQSIPDDAKVDADVSAILLSCDSSGDGKVDKGEFFKYFLSS